MNILQLLGFESHHNKQIIGTNFREFGPSFGVHDFDDFLNLAREFYREGMNATDKTYYTIIELPDGGVGIDYDGQKRGIYTRRGEPIAFFRPDFQRRGYGSKSEELNDWITTSEAA